MFVIFDDIADASAYVAQINVALGYPCPGVPPTPRSPDGSPGYGWTVTWCVPFKSYSDALWAVVEAPAGSGVPFPPSAVDLLDALPASWYPPDV